MTTIDASALTSASAADLAAGVRSHRFSAVEITQAHLARIAALDPDLGAFQCVSPSRALAEARVVDSRADLESLPLAGVPVAIKDNMAATGYPARFGTPATHSRPCRQDDELIRRVRAAGAVIIGVTRMPELAIWPFGQSRLGVTRHPADPRLDPGGSTGGGAVAVATGMAALALGTDGGGSIRIPAAPDWSESSPRPIWFRCPAGCKSIRAVWRACRPARPHRHGRAHCAGRSRGMPDRRGFRADPSASIRDFDAQSFTVRQGGFGADRSGEAGRGRSRQCRWRRCRVRSSLPEDVAAAMDSALARRNCPRRRASRTRAVRTRTENEDNG